MDVNIRPCVRCGRDPIYFAPRAVSADDDFHYLACPNDLECGAETEWATTKKAVVKLWNKQNRPSRSPANAQP